jgi:hypothetical protein
MTWTDLYHLSSGHPEAARMLLQHAMRAVHDSANASLHFSVSAAPASAFATCLALDAYGVPISIDSSALLQTAR